MSQDSVTEFACSLPQWEFSHIVLAHGGGGKLTHDLIRNLFLPALRNPILETLHDSATFSFAGPRLAFTTDSYVVSPLFFPGGDIGKLAVYGTVNDLAMCGARPQYLSAAFIIEEGLPTELLARVIESMAQAAKISRVELVTGDTKVVDKGKGDGLFICTSGVGTIEHPFDIGPGSVRPGDVIILNGDVGRHGMAILASRQGLSFESTIESDCAPLASAVLRLLDAAIEIHCLRDLTRGGLGTALIEIAQTAGLNFSIDESAIQVRPEVTAACEILGIDPFYVANEGRFIAILPSRQAEKALTTLKSDPLGVEAKVIGYVEKPPAGHPGGQVTLKTLIGTARLMAMPSGEQLPRIC